jgi:hypothetical protein
VSPAGSPGNSADSALACAYPRSVPTTPCRFCGATDRKITKEHVWPEWLEDFVPPTSGPGLAHRWSSGDGHQSWKQQMLSATVRMFCEPCNTGWMSDIEAEAKYIVGPMVQGIPTTLDTAAQRAVANWTVLKGLVAAQTSKTPQPIPDRHYRQVYAAKGAPANTVRVWIGQRRNLATPGRPGKATLFASDFMPVTNVARQFPLPANVGRYIRNGGVFNGAVFQVGHFLALVIQHDWPGLQVRPKPGSDAEQAFISIWPTGADVLWPPPGSVDVLGNVHRVTEFFEFSPPLVSVDGP